MGSDGRPPRSHPHPLSPSGALHSPHPAPHRRIPPTKRSAQGGHGPSSERGEACLGSAGVRPETQQLPETIKIFDSGDSGSGYRVKWEEEGRERRVGRGVVVVLGPATATVSSWGSGGGRSGCREGGASSGGPAPPPRVALRGRFRRRAMGTQDTRTNSPVVDVLSWLLFAPSIIWPKENKDMN